MKKIKYLLLVLLISLLSAQTKSVIAIADVSADGLSNFEIKQFFNRLESDLVNLGQYRVTSRQEVDKILTEQKFQKSGCTDQQCAAEIGRMLNADFMLLSNVLFDASSGDINITLKLVDVETAGITTSISKDATVSRARDINANLSDYILELYRKDSGEQATGFYQPQKQELGYGSLIIETTPVGATIILDNEQRGATPITIDKIEAGQHSIILHYTGYERLTKAVMITPDETTTVSELLIKRTGHLHIVSDPKESDVYVNEEYKGTTPLTLQYLDIGAYFVKVIHDGYDEKIAKVTVEWNKTKEVNQTLSAKPASVILYSVPDGATVYVDKKKVGKTTMTGLVVDITHGVRYISMKKKGYEPEATTLNFTAGQNTSLELQLSKLPEGVSEDPNAGWVNINGWPRDSYVQLNGDKLNLPIRYKEFKKGEYSYKVSKDGYHKQKIPFKIKPQKLTESKFQLLPVDKSTAHKRAFMFPGLGHFYAEKPLKGAMWAGLEIASLYGAYFMLSDYFDKKQAYNTAHDNYLAAHSHDDIHVLKTAYQEAYDKQNISLYGFSVVCGVASVVWGWNVFDLYRSIPAVLPFPKDAKLKIGVNKKGELETQVEF